MAQALLAASDAVLAGACLFAASCLSRAGLSPLVRVAALGGIAMTGAAAMVGAVRFAGLENLGLVHRFLSDQSAIVAMPALALALFVQRTGALSSGASMRLRVVGGIAATGLLVAAVLQQRLAAALLTLAVLAALLAVQPRRVQGPAVLLAGLILAGATRAWTNLALETRLIALHLILAGWFGVYACVLRPDPR